MDRMKIKHCTKVRTNILFSSGLLNINKSVTFPLQYQSSIVAHEKISVWPSILIKGSLQKKKNKKCGFFPHWGGGGQPQIHTFLKVWIFKGGWGVLGPISTLFCPILFFFKNFVLFYPVFVGWKVIFRVKLKKNFFPQNCFPPFGGGGGSGRCGKNPHFLFFFFLKASLSAWLCCLSLSLWSALSWCHWKLKSLQQSFIYRDCCELFLIIWSVWFK